MIYGASSRTLSNRYTQAVDRGVVTSAVLHMATPHSSNVKSPSDRVDAVV